MPDEAFEVVSDQAIDALEQYVLAELSALPLVQPPARLDAEIEGVLAQAGAVEEVDVVETRAGWFVSPSRRSLSMAAMLILAVGLGVVVGTRLPGGGPASVDPGLQAVVSDPAENQDTRSGADIVAFPVAGVSPLPGAGYRWEREPESEWILSESAPVSSVVTNEAGEPKRAWGTQAVRRSVYVDQNSDAKLELIQPDQRVIWVSQPVY